MKKTWRDVASELEERFGYTDGLLRMPGFAMRINPERGIPRADNEAAVFYAPSANAKFLEAAGHYRRGDDAYLYDYLRSNEPIGEGERALLAELIKLPAKDCRAEHKNRVRFAAWMGRNFYKEISEECKRQGVSYRGCSRQIRQMCAKFVAITVSGVTGREVLDVMTRPVGRRTLGNEPTTVTFGPLTIRMVPIPAKTDP